MLKGKAKVAACVYFRISNRNFSAKAWSHQHCLNIGIWGKSWHGGRLLCVAAAPGHLCPTAVLELPWRGQDGGRGSQAAAAEP